MDNYIIGNQLIEYLSVIDVVNLSLTSHNFEFYSIFLYKCINCREWKIKGCNDCYLLRFNNREELERFLKLFFWLVNEKKFSGDMNNGIVVRCKRFFMDGDGYLLSPEYIEENCLKIYKIWKCHKKIFIMDLNSLIIRFMFRGWTQGEQEFKGEKLELNNMYNYFLNIGCAKLEYCIDIMTQNNSLVVLIISNL